MTPATPAAAWVWPRLDFNEPSHRGRSADRPCPYAASSACASIGSPSAVPVPCASTVSMSAGESPASVRAAWITRCCAGPWGAVSPLDAPSELTAEPRSTASTGCPLRRASDSRSNSTRPTPSPQAVPSAAAENGLQRPSGASPRSLLNAMNGAGEAMTVTPPATAREHSPSRSDRAAACRATSDDEHAVSTVTAGPRSPRVYAIRPDATLPAEPSARWASNSCPAPCSRRPA